MGLETIMSISIEQLIDQSKNIEKLIQTIHDRWNHLGLNDKINSIEAIKNMPDFWTNPDQTNILKNYKKYEDLKKNFIEINEKQLIINQLIDGHKQENSSSSSNLEFLQEIENELYAEIKNQNKHVKNFRIKLLMDKEDDNKNCFFDINSGAGGTESQDWAEMLLRMYLRFFERNNFSYSLLDCISGEEAGIKSATIFIKGDYASGLLSCEVGIHRLVRISPFDANKRRHTSFAAVSISPEAPDINIIINSDDLRIDTYRAGGAGGQHVNKTDSAVRITHIPSGIVVQCQNERSQLQNKEFAMKMLKSRLHKREQDALDFAKNNKDKKKIEWGSQIRSYVLHPYKMVKDHRTDFESFNTESVLDGEIIDFIESYLIIR